MNATAFDGAFEDDATRPPVILPLLILEFLWALIAQEFCVVKRLLDKAVNFIAQVYVAPAVGTRVVLFRPLFDARATAQLVALLALLGVFNHRKANRTCEVLIDAGNCTLRRQLLRCINT